MNSTFQCPLVFFPWNSCASHRLLTIEKNEELKVKITFLIHTSFQFFVENIYKVICVCYEIGITVEEKIYLSIS